MIKFIAFQDENQYVVATDKIKYIKIDCGDLLLSLKEEATPIRLFYKNSSERDEDYARIKKLLTNQNISTESVKGLLNTVKNITTEKIDKAMKEPIGFRFKRDYNGVMHQYNEGDVANVAFFDDGYYVLSKKFNARLFKAISTEGSHYGTLIYDKV